MSGRFEAFLERLESHGDRESLVCDGGTHRYTDLLREFGLGARPYRHTRNRTTERRRIARRLLAADPWRRVCTTRRPDDGGAMLPRDRAADALLADCHATALLDIDPQGQWNWTTLAGID